MSNIPEYISQLFKKYIFLSLTYLGKSAIQEDKYFNFLILVYISVISGIFGLNYNNEIRMQPKRNTVRFLQRFLSHIFSKSLPLEKQMYKEIIKQVKN